MSNDLHQATGSMPAQPEEEKIEAPEEAPETGLLEPSNDIPDENELDNGSSDLGEGAEASPEAAGATESNDTPSDGIDSQESVEGEFDPNGGEPVVEPINE